MIFSVTGIRNFKRCRRMWDYSSSSRQSLSPIVKKPALDLGTLIHLALKDWLEIPNVTLVEHFILNSSFEEDAIRERYKERVGARMSDEELGKFYDVVILGRAMCENYQAHWRTPLPSRFKLVTPEQEILVPLRNGHTLSCRMDAILISERQDLWLLEHKTFGRQPMIETLDVDEQFIEYLWILEQMNIGNVGGIAYDGLLKRAEPGNNQTLKDLFFRHLLRRTPRELVECEEELLAVTGEMGNDPYIYKNRRWEGCADCSYDAICRAQSKGDDISYIKSQSFTTVRT